NQRLFNVLINGDPALMNFDIFATAGGKDIAISRQFECLSDSSGQIVIQFTTLRDNAKVSGIQVTPAPDLALGKQAYASSVESSNYAPNMAVDGNSSTRWSSGQWMQNSNIGWIYVDLGAPFNISEVRLNWETAYAVNYQIQVSYDAVNWTTIQVISGNQSKGVADFSGLTGTGRYVRILCTQTSAGSDNYSLYDFNVYGTPITDLAQNRPTYASSVESSYYPPSMAVDGNSSTRWSSGQWMQNSSTGWIYVDLGAPFNISEVRLNWETAYAVNYQIQVSDDAVNWTTIQNVTGNQSKGVADFSDLSGTGRYVRILCTQTSAGSDNYSLYDFNVYGTPITDLAQNQPAYASSVESSNYAPSMAVDGNSSTRWSSGQWMQNSNIGWIYVDLGAPFNISEVRLNWETAYAVNYQIQVSDDAVNWTTIQNVTGNQSKGVADFSDLSGTGRYVRILCTQTSAGSDNYSLYDFNVYGTPITDLAQNQPAYASSVESSNYAPSMAVDGNSSTRWSSGQWMQNSNIGWIYVDLGAPFNISEVRLNWETAYAVNYQIQVSDDAVNWTTIQNVTGNQSKGVADFSDLSGTGRYVRILCTQTSAGSDNYSLYDFNVYGTPITDLAQNQPAYASSVESSNYAPSMAVDGNSSTRWSSGQWMQNSNIGWIYVELGAPFNISEVRLNWETAYAVNYQIQVSDDAVNWTTIQNVTDNQSKAVVDFSGLSGIGRYVRILCTQTSAGSDNYSLYDFNVYGTPAEPGSLGPAGLLSALTSNAGTTGSSETAAPALSGTSQAVGTSPVGNSTTITTTPPINAFALGTTPPINAFALGTTLPINANLASRLSARGPHQASV